MALSKLVPAMAAAALLVACEARIGNDAPPVEENASAAGRAEEGRLTVEAPGFNMSISIPEGIRSRAEMDEGSLLYPGSDFAGMHIQGGGDGPGAEGGGEVELRFTTGDAPGQVVGWYRDPARGQEFTLEAARQEADGFVVTGTDRQDGDRFTLRIAPGAGGGTEGRLLLSDSN
jgi:hypothetical protein